MPKSFDVQVLDSGRCCPRLTIVEGKGEARAVVWPKMGAERRSMTRIRLDPTARTVRLSHPMEAVYYVIGGGGMVGESTASGSHNFDLTEGSMVHIEPETSYIFTAGPDGLDIIGGPCPADPELYKYLA